MSHISISLSQETSKLQKELVKVIVLDIISGQTSDDILLEFLPGALNKPRVDAVYEIKGNSYLGTLCSEKEALKASKIGELGLPLRLGPCVISISKWTAEVGSVGKRLEGANFSSFGASRGMHGRGRCWWIFYKQLVI